MSSKTRIVVLRMKEIIYTAIFIGLAILLIMLFLFMFRPKPKTSSPSEKTAPASATYTPGLYSSSIQLGSQNVNVEVAVDAERITSIALVPLSDAVATMYPLMEPAMDILAEQILTNQSLEALEYPAGSQYTSMALVNAIQTALNKAEIVVLEE